MASEETLQVEIERLREQIEGYRLGELDSLRTQLAEAGAAVVHYRAEAERNADLGRQIHREAEAELAHLRTRIQSLEQLPNARTNA